MSGCKIVIRGHLVGVQTFILGGDSMLIAIEMITLIIAVAVPLALIGVCALSGSRKPSKTVKVVSTERTVRQNRSVIELTDVASGKRYTKGFRGRLIMGRRMEEKEPPGFLYLDSDPTISRNQLRITNTMEGLVLENLSGVNFTRLNGGIVSRPAIVRRGDYLQMGNLRCIVSGIYKG